MMIKGPGAAITNVPSSEIYCAIIAPLRIARGLSFSLYFRSSRRQISVVRPAWFNV